MWRLAVEHGADLCSCDASGVEQYWVVDPLEPSVTIWTHRDGRVGEPLVVTGGAAVDGPVPVVLRPARLVD